MTRWAIRRCSGVGPGLVRATSAEIRPSELAEGLRRARPWLGASSR